MRPPPPLVAPPQRGSRGRMVVMRPFSETGLSRRRRRTSSETLFNMQYSPPDGTCPFVHKKTFQETKVDSFPPAKQKNHLPGLSYTRMHISQGTMRGISSSSSSCLFATQYFFACCQGIKATCHTRPTTNYFNCRDYLAPHQTLSRMHGGPFLLC